MFRKNIFIVISVFVVLGLVSGIAFANEVIVNESKDNIDLEDVIQEDAKEIIKENSTFDDMIELMNENGYQDMAKYMSDNDDEAMNDFMNNLTQEDFDAMIEIMNENGYGVMGDGMESIGREDMIQMHETMRQYHMGNDFSGGPMMER